MDALKTGSQHEQVVLSNISLRCLVPVMRKLSIVGHGHSLLCLFNTLKFSAVQDSFTPVLITMAHHTQLTHVKDSLVLSHRVPGVLAIPWI